MAALGTGFELVLPYALTETARSNVVSGAGIDAILTDEALAPVSGPAEKAPPVKAPDISETAGTTETTVL